MMSMTSMMKFSLFLESGRIGRKHNCNPDDCLLDVLQEWLGTAKDDQRHGHPSWQVLVKAVAHPAGGNNRALAEAIAQKYSGIY